jgi:hypothetical protein
MRVLELPDRYCKRLTRIVDAAESGAPDYLRGDQQRRTRDRVCWAIEKLEELLELDNGTADTAEPVSDRRRARQSA